MKRLDLVRHLQKQKCFLVREGGKHSIFFNPINRQTSSVPRHTEIANPLAKKICKDLGIPSAMAMN